MRKELPAEQVYLVILDGGEGGMTVLLCDEGDEAAVEWAKEWARRGEWDFSDGTVFASLYIERVGGEEVSQILDLPIDPPEPACEIKDVPHTWVEVGEHLHGGGVMIEEVCDLCGLRRLTNTWAQSPRTGKQGLRSVRYEQPS